ncbi:NUDIX domain-containing protein [Treponema sp. OMZ 840]|uniref:NUDIX domain-containing protein n=1 Tax=Treponema sp. OMZ 840 TaxID=244313 RepID=UPI003D8A176C
MEKILSFIIDNYIFLFVAFALVYFNQLKKGGICRKKRKAVLIMFACAFLYWLFLYVIVNKNYNPYFSFVGLAILAVFVFVFRAVMWPFSRLCRKCGKELSITQILTVDENTCDDCFFSDHPDLLVKPEEKVDEKLDDLWTDWRPDKTFVLCFVLNNKNQVLLVERKYKEKGSGKVSGPISLLQEQENAVEVCKKSVYTETGLSVEQPSYQGRLNFSMPGKNFRCHIYVTSKYTGCIKETELNRPFWASVKRLPFLKMSVDYRVWLPIAIDKGFFDYYGTCDEKGYVVKDRLYRKNPAEETEDL